MAVSLKNISKRFNGFSAIENISLEIDDHKFICLVGPSGCGKTTLLRIIAGLETPTDGWIEIDHKPVSANGMAIGFVFQENALFPWLTVKQNIEFGLEVRKYPAKQMKEISEQYLRLIGLSDFRDYYPHQLSGGMKQRVGIARAMAYNPRLLLMDEPFVALDAQTRNHMQRELLELWQLEQKTVLFVTHNIDEAVFLAEQVVVFSESPGQIKEVVDISLPRPRERTSAEFNAFRARILNLIDSRN